MAKKEIREKFQKFICVFLKNKLTFMVKFPKAELRNKFLPELGLSRVSSQLHLLSIYLILFSTGVWTAVAHHFSLRTVWWSKNHYLVCQWPVLTPHH